MNFCLNFFPFFCKNKCNIRYIPKKLHWGNKKVITEFEDSELLFYRADSTKSNPYSSIKLTDISFNRSGKDNLISSPEDVLWNIDPTKGFEKYISPIVPIKLSINRIDLHKHSKNYQFPEIPNEGKYFVEMKLIHDPLPCNYAHSMIIFNYENQQVKWEGYEKGFGKSNRDLKNLRQICRDEIHKMIIQKEISFSD